MANFKKLAKRRLPPPPPPEDASTALQEPEIAPAAVAPQKKIDGRRLRKTGRTIQFATRVTEKFDKKFRAVAKRDELMLAALLERALDAYERSRKDSAAKAFSAEAGTGSATKKTLKRKDLQPPVRSSRAGKGSSRPPGRRPPKRSPV